MFIHNFKYALKTLFRNKMLLFWTYAFPLILGTFFDMAFSNIENSEKLEIIDIAIVENEDFKNDKVLKEVFNTLSEEENEERLFNTQYVTEEKAKGLLQNKEVVGYLIVEKEKPKLVFQSNGIDQTIFKYVTEEITQNSEIVRELSENEIKNQIMQGNKNLDNEKIYKNILEKIQKEETKIKNVANQNLSYTMVEFYTLIAMACLYGGMFGMVVINQNLANMSSNGKRVSIAPTNKAKVVLSSCLAGYVAQIIGLVLLFTYTIFVLKVDYGSNLPFVVLLGAIGSLAGLSMGLAIATLLKANENKKTGVLIAITMLGCFLSGMMGITMKYIVDKNFCLINKINPASMITDGFYSLYYYDTLDRYYFNIISLLIFIVLAIFISYISLRRQRYDSI